LVTVAAWLVAADRHIGMHLHPRLEVRSEPLFERAQLELPRAPPRARRGGEVVVLAKPEVKIAIRIEARDRPPEETFKPVEERIDLRELLAGVGEEVLERKIRLRLTHMDSERRAVAPAGNPQNVPLLHAAHTASS